MEEQWHIALLLVKTSLSFLHVLNDAVRRQERIGLLLVVALHISKVGILEVLLVDIESGLGAIILVDAERA